MTRTKSVYTRLTDEEYKRLVELHRKAKKGKDANFSLAEFIRGRILK